MEVRRERSATAKRLPTGRLAAAIACLDDPFVLARLKARGDGFRIEYVNLAFETIAGRSIGDLRRRDLADVLTELGCEAAAQQIAGATGSKLYARLNGLKVAGERGRRDFELIGYALSDSTPDHAFLLRDITQVSRKSQDLDRDRQKLEKLVSDRTQKLEELHERLRLSERLASIGTIGAGLCHDMNNLLMPMRGHLDAAEEDGLSDSQLAHFTSIREAIGFLQQLTNGLRLFALDPDEPAASPAATRLARWWQQLKPLLVRTIPDHINLDVKISEDCPPVGVAAHRLTQAILNLLINAGDAVGAQGSIRLWADLTDDSRFVKLGVADDGRGMTREAQRHALDPFFTTKTRQQSTGLGLSLVHGIVHAAGGRVDIESTPGRGTTIILYLPIEVDNDRTSVSETSGEAALAVVDVEDPRIAACFESFLRSAGFDVERQDDGALAAAAVWVTDASTGALAQARRRIETNSRCRVIAYGRGSPEWEEFGATVVNQQAGLEGIREAISQLILAAEEQA